MELTELLPESNVHVSSFSCMARYGIENQRMKEHTIIKQTCL